MAVDPSCYRPQSKRKRRITRDWMEKCLVKAFTDTEIIEKIRGLPDRDLVRLYMDFLPKEIKQLEANTTVTLVIQGLERRVLGTEQIIEALPPGNDE